MKLAIVYSSQTGNTEELVCIISQLFLKKHVEVDVFRVEQFPIMELAEFRAIVICTYTWGKGEIPLEMEKLFHAFEYQNVKNVITGVAGTGDSGYLKFCGAVDEFRDMLYVRTKLAVTLKIEVSPQRKDFERCRRFVNIIVEQLYLKKKE